MVKKQVKTKRRKINKNKVIKVLLIIVAVIVFIIIAKNAGEKLTSDKTILILQNEDITSDLEKEIIKQDDIIYISFNDVKKFFDKNIYQENGLIITSSDKKLAVMNIDSNKIKINSSNINLKGKVFKDLEGTIYLPISEMGNVYDVDFSYNEQTNIITIDYYSKKLIKAYAKNNIKIKNEKSWLSDTVQKIKKGNWLICISDEEEWTKVRTQEGKIGYVKSKKLTNYVTEREDMQEKEFKAEKYLKTDISKKNISTFEKREKIINKILLNAVNKDYKGVKITYKNKKEQEIERFKIEIKPIFKECGIDVKYEGK